MGVVIHSLTQTLISFPANCTPEEQANYLSFKKLEAQKSAKGLGARVAGFKAKARAFRTRVALLQKKKAQSHSQTIFVENKLGNNSK